MPASKISLDKAKQDKLFYFVANAVVVRTSDMRCLILKRDERETAHPGKYAVVGGKLEWGDLDIQHPSRLNDDVLDYQNAIEDLLIREAKEESGVDIGRDLRYINSMAFIRPDGIPVVFIKFAAEYKGGEVIPEKGAFTDFAWVNAEEAKKYDCIEGIPEEIAEAIDLFSG
jgi:ADP-ribose pyrophosphatase YjhB (NUDIX family)